MMTVLLPGSESILLSSFSSVSLYSLSSQEVERHVRRKGTYAGFSARSMAMKAQCSMTWNGILQRKTKVAKV